MTQVRLLKRGEGFWLGGQWKVLGLVANGRFLAWWPMEGEGEDPFAPTPTSPQANLP